MRTITNISTYAEAVAAIDRLHWAVGTAIERADAQVRHLADADDYCDYLDPAEDAVIAALADVPLVNRSVPDEVLEPDAAGADRVAYATAIPGVRVVVTYDRDELTAEVDLVDKMAFEAAFEDAEDA